MYCNNCGGMIPDGMTACPDCGKPIPSPDKPSSAGGQGALDPERYEQLLALKAQKDAEEAELEAQYALQQAEEARRRAAEARLKYAQQYGAQQVPA